MPGSPRLVAVALIQPLILLVAWAMGRGAYAVLKSRVRLPAATMTIASVVGISIGLVIAGWAISDLELWSPVALAAAFAGAVLVLAVVTAVAPQQRRGPGATAHRRAGRPRRE